MGYHLPDIFPGVFLFIFPEALILLDARENEPQLLLDDVSQLLPLLLTELVLLAESFDHTLTVILLIDEERSDLVRGQIHLQVQQGVLILAIGPLLL